MGKLITFWSPYKGHGMTTSSVCAIAGGFMLQYPECKIAISYTQQNTMSLAEKLDGRTSVYKRKELYENLGINALKMYIRQMELTDEIIGRCGIPLQSKSVYFYPNIHTIGEEENIAFVILTRQLKRSFDIVLLDLESDNKKGAVSYMKEADFSIIMLPQERAYVEAFLREEKDFLEQVNYGIVFGGSFTGSKYSSAYYKKNTDKMLGGKILGEIYQNAGFFDAMCSGKTLEFFLRNQRTVKKEENYEFICQAKKTAESIGKKIIFT